MSGTSQRDEQLLSIGKQCSDPLCRLVDFLPIKCDHCHQPYCSEHFLPQTHKCEKFNEFEHNRVAPPCPFCKIPIAIPKGEDPNIRMERHFDNDCSVLTGNSSKAGKTPRCARPKCGKVLFAPIKCEKCHEQFCPAHRYPNTHSCNPTASSSSRSTPNRSNVPSGAAAIAAIQRAMNPQNSTTSSRSTPVSSSTRAARTAATPIRSTPSASSSSTSSPRSNPFSATDRSPSSSVTITMTSQMSILPTIKQQTDNSPNNNNINPPGRYSPKLPTTTIFDPMAFIPKPIFGNA